MEIKRKMVTKAQSNNAEKPLKSIDYITIHCTGNYGSSAGAENHANYVYNGAGGGQAGFHYVADAKEIWQMFEDNQVCWHAGDGANGTGNNTSIAIEICVNSIADFPKACANTAWLTAELLKKHRLPVERVVQHNHWSGKNCPAEIRGGKWGVTWVQFIDMVQETLKKLTQPGTSKLTAITGKSAATVEQMTAYLKRVNPNVPQSVLNLIPLYLSEGAEENIRGDIAFAQSCLETGNFTFSGGTAVTFGQNNFCGYGVTSLGEKGASFASRQMGVRAQIQHLKAYANKEALKNPVVAPTAGESRFRFVERGVSPYVEWLGQKENPSGKGWAAGAGYGGKILNILGAILSVNTVTPSQKGETRNITVTFGSTKYILDGVPFDEPVMVYNGVAYLPAAYLAAKLGLSANWDAKTNVTTLTSNKK